MELRNLSLATNYRAAYSENTRDYIMSCKMGRVMYGDKAYRFVACTSEPVLGINAPQASSTGGGFVIFTVLREDSADSQL